MFCFKTSVRETTYENFNYNNSTNLTLFSSVELLFLVSLEKRAHSDLEWMLTCMRHELYTCTVLTHRQCRLRS